MRRAVTLCFLLALIMMILPNSIFGVIGRSLLVAGSLGALSLTFSRSSCVSKVEATWVSILILFVITGTLSAILSVRPESGYLDAGRQLFIAVTSFAMVMHFRHNQERELFRLWLLIPAVISGLIIIAGFYLIMGFPSLDAISDLGGFKYEMDGRFGINPNPLSFSMMVLLILSWRGKVLSSSLVYKVSVIVVVVAILLSGARTTVVVFVFGGVLFYIVQNKIFRFAAFFLLAGILFNVYWAFDFDFVEGLYFLSDITTGRFELWLAALTKFSERPWFGWGAGTWDMDLSSYLTLYSSDMSRFDELSSGAFHNSYLTLLAEKGLVGFFWGVLLFVYLLNSAVVVYKYIRSSFPSLGPVAAIYPLFVIVIAIRGLSENGGLFGYANGALDFVVFAGASLIIATRSQLNKKALLRYE